jgi:cytochrome c oxidase assembly protein subunit 15
MVEFFGYPEMADKIRHDESILEHEEFNAAKTWTEYINRLVGVATGFCLLFTAIFSFTYIKTKTPIFVWSVLNLFVVIFQAWLGSIVVSTNLMPWIITVHMVLALVILAIAIYTFFLATTLRNKDILINYPSVGLQTFGGIFVALTIVQVIFGTDVRELIDHLNDEGAARATWIERVGWPYEVHRWIAYLTLALGVGYFFLIKNRFSKFSLQSKYAGVMLVLLLIQMLSGVILVRFDVPAFAQTTHLVVASLFFAAQFYLVLLMKKARV